MSNKTKSIGRPSGSATIDLDRPALVRAEMLRVYRLAKGKKLDTLDATRLVSILKEILACIRTDEIEVRLAALEEKLLKNGKH